VSEFEPDASGRELFLGRESRFWKLKLDEINPGLRLRGAEGSGHARLLAMGSVATIGRCDGWAFHRASLADVALHRGRIEATYAPAGWEGLQVRAAWSPVPLGDGVDLEVQVHATTARVIERVEVGISSDWGSEITGPSASQVEPRDVDSARLSYDGREPPGTLHHLTTLPIPPSSPHSLPPRIFTPPGADRDTYYVEMVRPDDCARRTCPVTADRQSGPATTLSTQYSLFGHDLEKGVVLRARLRGLWIHSRTPERDVRASYEAFLSEPLAMGP
jgi:hypothetical protein